MKSFFFFLFFSFVFVLIEILIKGFEIFEFFEIKFFFSGVGQVFWLADRRHVTFICIPFIISSLKQECMVCFKRRFISVIWLCSASLWELCVVSFDFLSFDFFKF